MTLLNGYIIIVWSPLTVCLCFCMFPFMIKLTLGLKFSIDKRQAEDMAGSTTGFYSLLPGRHGILNENNRYLVNVGGGTLFG